MSASSASLSLLQAAATAAGAQQYPAATLYVVASPIGNLADFSLRAVHALSLVNAVACEDTRVTAGLLRHLGLDKPLIAVHEHNEQSATEKVLARLAQGERVAYLSDAGTPAVSDPGAVLAHLVRAAGHRVLPLPGPSAVVTALSAAGCVSAAGPGFHFAGFLPAKGQDRETGLQAALAQPCPTVLFEAPHRIESLADRLAELAPDRPVTVCRELTKQFEQIDTLPALQLPAWFAADAQRRKGEFALVLHAPAPARVDDPGLPPEVERALRVLTRDLPLKQAVALASELTGAPRNALYEQALAWRQAAQQTGDDEDAAG
ncbi:16S rRNA (cytidine(1402)-2'-O)-methyltransferase [Ideonella oryzae]|uniref:Ribosomal RNA small subunit methyltransferase I n=1 Tax=Ideonella oryzae TaxID=2937441 RepID=A0ABT1BQT5_9BURK|nr:16S rRNA (cytidine(1402)-2'-O)-methyltransferase [Ideonella oryzae]MCO5978605.1 16S rRNA (cytidine(1402)-2'-O)-methyltransferase [Ideonella oryzae]